LGEEQGVDGGGRPRPSGKSRFRKIPLTPEDWNRLVGIACCASKVFDGLELVGVDLKLEAQEDPLGAVSVTGVVLDANPRPAGLMHSDSLPKGPERSTPCICSKMWLGFDPSRK